MFRRKYYFRFSAIENDKQTVHWRLRTVWWFKNPIELVNQEVEKLENSGHSSVDLLEIKRI